MICSNCGKEFFKKCNKPEMKHWSTLFCKKQCFIDWFEKGDDYLRIRYKGNSYTVEYDYKRKSVTIPKIGETKITKLDSIILSPHELLEALDFGVEAKAKKEAKKSEPKD